MKTKKDYWRTILYAYILIILGILLLFFKIETLPIIPQMIAVIVLGLLGVYILFKAIKIYQVLDDKNIYPSQLDFLNKMAFKFYGDKKRARTTLIIAIIVGIILGVFLAPYII